jgi:hypothetical protein
MTVFIDFAFVETITGDQLGAFEVACPCGPKRGKQVVLRVWKSSPTFARWCCSCGARGYAASDGTASRSEEPTVTAPRPSPSSAPSPRPRATPPVWAFDRRNFVVGVAVPEADGSWRATVGGRSVGRFGTAAAAMQFLIRLAERSGGRSVRP